MSPNSNIWGLSHLLLLVLALWIVFSSVPSAAVVALASSSTRHHRHSKRNVAAAAVGVAVEGTVLCDTCFPTSGGLGIGKAYYLQGVSVEVECRGAAAVAAPRFRSESRTNSRGVFRAHLGARVDIRSCSVKLLRSSGSHLCAVAAETTTSSSQLRSRVKQHREARVYNVGIFTFRSLRQPELCSQKQQPGTSSIPSLTRDVKIPAVFTPRPAATTRPQQLPPGPRPFPRLPPNSFRRPSLFPPNPLQPPSLLPPNPLVPPPSLLPPNPLTPPPSLIPPNPLTPPPSLLPPNPFQRPPPSILPRNPFRPPSPPSFLPPNPFQQPTPPPSLLPPNPFQRSPSPPSLLPPGNPFQQPTPPPSLLPPNPFQRPPSPPPFLNVPGLPGLTNPSPPPATLLIPPIPFLPNNPFYPSFPPAAPSPP